MWETINASARLATLVLTKRPLDQVIEVLHQELLELALLLPSPTEPDLAITRVITRTRVNTA